MMRPPLALNPPEALRTHLLRVLELRQGLDRVLGGSWEYEFSLPILKLGDGDSDGRVSHRDILAD